jgi:argininosuccinate synthase
VIFYSLQKEPNIKITATVANVDTRGELLSVAKEKAKIIGVLKHFSNDDIAAFTSNYTFPVIKANALYVGKYPISTSLSTIPLITKNVAEIGKKTGVTGSTYGRIECGNAKSA